MFNLFFFTMTIKLPDPVFQFRDMNAELLHVYTDQTRRAVVDTRGRVSLDGAEVEMHVDNVGARHVHEHLLPSLRAGGQDDGSKGKKKKKERILTVTELDGNTSGVIYQ